MKILEHFKYACTEHTLLFVLFLFLFLFFVVVDVDKNLTSKNKEIEHQHNSNQNLIFTSNFVDIRQDWSKMKCSVLSIELLDRNSSSFDFVGVHVKCLELCLLENNLMCFQSISWRVIRKKRNHGNRPNSQNLQIQSK